MKLFFTAALLTILNSTAFAAEFEMIGSVYQNQKGEKIYVEKTKEDVQM